MFTNSPFASAATMFPGAEKFTPAAMQDAVKPFMDNLKAWSDLAQRQTQATQAAVAESVEAFKSIKEPQAALETMKTSAEKSMALTAKHLQEATALSVAQFNAGIDAMQESHPAPESFANVGKGLKAAAASMENAVASTLKNGAAAAKKASAA